MPPLTHGEASQAHGEAPHTHILGTILTTQPMVAMPEHPMNYCTAPAQSLLSVPTLMMVQGVTTVIQVVILVA